MSAVVPGSNHLGWPDGMVFIIGAMKSGTTSLFEILGQHPAICQSKEKEPDFYCEDRGDDAKESYMCLWDWRGGKHTYAMESSVAYSKAPNVPGVPNRIYRSGVSNNRFIYMLRNPLSRIESQVRHGLFAGWGKSLDEGVPDDAVNYSRYAMQIDEYLKYFPRDNFLLFTLEEFKDNPEGVLRQICDFLRIDNGFEFSAVGEARNSGDFFNAPEAVAKITQHPIGQFVAQKILSEGMKKKLRNLIAKLNRKGAGEAGLGRCKLTGKEERMVIAQLAPDLRRLRDELGVDIEKYWNISL